MRCAQCMAISAVFTIENRPCTFTFTSLIQIGAALKVNVEELFNP